MEPDNDELLDFGGMDDERDEDVVEDFDHFDEGEGEDWERERSPSPVNNESDLSDLKSKPRKRLVKKSDKHSVIPPELNDFEDEDGPGGDFNGTDSPPPTFRRDEADDDFASSSKKRKGKGGLVLKHGGGDEQRRREKNPRREKHVGSSSSGGGRLSSRRMKGNDGDPEMKEMWDTIAGDNSEEDQEGAKTVDDDNFIDDSGLDPSERYRSDNEAGSPSRFAQAEEGEEDDEMNDLFKAGKKKKKSEKSASEISYLVERIMAELEVVAEEDAKLNVQGKPAINKLKKLPLLIDALSKKLLQHEFLDHGVLTLLRTWLEPLPDGSLPNFNIREAILKILTDYPIDLDQHDRREQLKKSGLGKVVMFLSRSDEETSSNRRLAKDLVDKWSRPIFNKSTTFEEMRNNKGTRFEEMRNYDDERMQHRRSSVKKPASRSSGSQSKDDDLDLRDTQFEKNLDESASRLHASRPEAMSMDFVVRPQSKIDPDEIRARAKQVVQDQRRLKMNKKLQHLKATKKKKLQATKVSVEGRGMVKYL